MNSKSGENKGGITVSDESILILTARTALETEGVAGLSGLLTEVITDKIAKNFHLKESASKGIRLSKGDDGYTLDIYITVDYDVNIPTVAFNLQKNVRNRVKSAFDIKVNAVNVRVQGVKFPQDNRRI